MFWGLPLKAALDDISNSSKGASLTAVTAGWEVNKKLQEVNKKHIQARSTSSMYQTSSCFSSGLAVGEAVPRASRQPLPRLRLLCFYFTTTKSGKTFLCTGALACSCQKPFH